MVDEGNNRVLEYDDPFTTDTQPDRVFGQGGSFTSSACNQGAGITAATLCNPDRRGGWSRRHPLYRRLGQLQGAGVRQSAAHRCGGSGFRTKRQVYYRDLQRGRSQRRIRSAFRPPLGWIGPITSMSRTTAIFACWSTTTRLRATPPPIWFSARPTSVRAATRARQVRAWGSVCAPAGLALDSAGQSLRFGRHLFAHPGIQRSGGEREYHAQHGFWAAQLWLGLVQQRGAGTGQPLSALWNGDRRCW